MDYIELSEELTSQELKQINGGEIEWIFALAPVISVPLALGIWVGYNSN